VFANVFMYPEKPGITGKFKKFNFLTGETVWEIRTRIRTGAERSSRTVPRLLRQPQR